MTAVDDVDLDIAAGEFFSMLGPSGSGKTTVLRLIAGFELPTAGTVELFGQDVTDQARPFDRDVNTVFQDYALFPHMSVLDNVAYGLRVRGVGRKERRERAAQALAAVRLEQLRPTASPSQLSGGQRQRVALARATVVQPKVLLLDEPLGALDLKLREQMQVELKQIQRELGITFIFVTHDQEEALTLSATGSPCSTTGASSSSARRASSTSSRHPGSSPTSSAPRTCSTPTARSALLGRAGEHSIRPEKLTLVRVEPGSGDGRALGAGHRRRVDLPRQRIRHRRRSGCRRPRDRARAERPLARLPTEDRGDRVHVELARRATSSPSYPQAPDPGPQPASAAPRHTAHERKNAMKHITRGSRDVGAVAALAIGLGRRAHRLRHELRRRQHGGGDDRATELGEMEGSVSILAWPGYVEDGSNDPTSTG